MGRPKRSKTPPVFGTPQKPLHLSDAASAEWDRLMGEINASGLQITPTHRARGGHQEQCPDAVCLCRLAIGIVAHPASKSLDALRSDCIEVLTILVSGPAVAAPKNQGDLLSGILTER